MRDTTTYDLFKEDLAGNPYWIECVEGLAAAVNEMERFAANEPCDYFLFCALTGKVVERLHRRPVLCPRTTNSAEKLPNPFTERDVRMPGTIKYDIFKSNAAGKVLHVETIEGLAPATNRIEELATSDPTFDYFLYCGEAGIVVRLVHRTSPSPVVLSNAVSQKKAG